MLEAYGSRFNLDPILPWDAGLNGMKGTIMSGRQIIGETAWDRGLAAIRNNDAAGMRALVSPMRVVS